MVGVEQATPQSVVRSSERRTFDRLLMVVTFLLIFIMAARTPLDSDLWWHLSAGEETLTSGTILRTDVFSFTRAGTPWTNVYWLFDVTMAILFRWLGYLGLGLLVASLATISMALVYFQSEGPPALKTAALLLGAVVASVGWPPRPLLISLVLLALVGYIIFLYKYRMRSFLWILPLVFILWANTHGGFPLGFLLLGAVLSGEVLNHLLRIPSPNTLSWKKIFHLGLWSVACVPAVLVNPNGFQMWLLPFQTVGIQVLQQLIPEWASPDFHFLIQQSLLWLLFAVFAAVALSGKTMDASDLITVLIFAYMAMLARRNFSAFAIVAVPVLARYAGYALTGWQQRVPWVQWLVAVNAAEQHESRRSSTVKRVANFTIVALLGLAAIVKVYSVTHPAIVESYLTKEMPTRAVDWLAANRDGGRVFNEYDWGGYFQWRLRQFPVFVDGRTDVFGDQVIGEWITTISAKEGWQDTLESWQVDFVIVRPDRPIASLVNAQGWHLLYQDNQAVIYERK